MSALPRTIVEAYALAAGELGMYSAARLFCDELLAEGGARLVGELRDLVGPTYPVLDVVAERALDGGLASPDPEALLGELTGSSRVVVIGMESCLVDALAARLPESTKLGVVLDPSLHADAGRVAANLEGRATLCVLDDVIGWAGARSALVTAVYGSDGYRATVCGSWLRLMGADTRSMFGSLVGWNLLGTPMEAYPRWLQETVVGDFTAIIEAPP